jgi:hypothetical protein
MLNTITPKFGQIYKTNNADAAVKVQVTTILNRTHSILIRGLEKEPGAPRVEVGSPSPFYVLTDEGSHHDAQTGQYIVDMDYVINHTYSNTPPSAKPRFYNAVKDALVCLGDLIQQNPHSHQGPLSKESEDIFAELFSILSDPAIKQNVKLQAIKSFSQFWQDSSETLQKQLSKNLPPCDGYVHDVIQTYASQHPERVTNLDITA